MTTLAEKKHMSRVAELGCAVCRRMGHPGTPAELHHPRKGAGMGKRSGHFSVIPLCPEHHRGNTGVHGLGTKGFPKRWGFTEEDLLRDPWSSLKTPQTTRSLTVAVNPGLYCTHCNDAGNQGKQHERSHHLPDRRPRHPPGSDR